MPIKSLQISLQEAYSRQGLYQRLEYSNGILLYRRLLEETNKSFLVRFFSLLRLQEAEFDLRDPGGDEQVIQSRVASIY